MLINNFKEHFRKTLVLAWPVCLSNLGNIMVGVVDTAMVGGIQENVAGYSGTTAQAAVSLANGFYFMILVFGFGVSYGVTPLVAAADASGDVDENRQLLRHCLVVNVITNSVLFLVLLALSPLMLHLHQPEDVVRLAIPFLNVMMFGMVPLAVFSSFKQFAEGLSFTRVAMFITIGTNLLNVLFNWILIYGKLGFAPMNVMGSCWASFWARLLMALAMFLYLYYGRQFKKYWTGNPFEKLSAARLRKIFSIGATSGLQWVFEVAAFAFALVMIGWIGKREQAAHQIALQLAAMTYLIASGISAAASVRVGNQSGLGNVRGMREAAFSAFVMVIIAQAVWALCFIGLRFVLPDLFNKEEEVRHIVSSLLLIAALFQVSDGVQVVGLGVLRGMKDITIPTLITFVAYWLIGLPCSYLFAFKLGGGVEGVWYGLTLALTAAAIGLFVRFEVVTRRMSASSQ